MTARVQSFQDREIGADAVASALSKKNWLGGSEAN